MGRAVKHDVIGWTRGLICGPPVDKHGQNVSTVPYPLSASQPSSRSSDRRQSFSRA